MSGGSFTKGLLFGGILGAGITLLVAPMSGRAFREETRRKAGDLAERLKQRSDDLLDRARRATEALRTSYLHEDPPEAPSTPPSSSSFPAGGPADGPQERVTG
jgi:hypothetical protein